MWLQIILRSVLLWIDKVVAWLITQAYSLLLMIADTTIISGDTIKELTSNVYALVAIFMLFKLSFSMINYILNPDDFSDKSKGASKIITNIFVVLILLVSVNTIFEKMFEFQGYLLKNNTIERIVLGTSAESSGNNSKEKAGKFMGYSVYTAFIRPNEDVLTSDCSTLYIKAAEENTSCIEEIKGHAGASAIMDLQTAINNKDAQLIFNYDLLTARTGDDEFVFNYPPIIATICAGFVAWIIIVFCIDVAVRAVKIGFLQLIAPIPIISYIDPKSSKDGMLKKWAKQVIKIYLDIFMRLAALFFAVFIIQQVTSNDMKSIASGEVVSINNNPLVVVFIILGALLFAKKIPQLVEDLLGVKLGGDFTLNPLKKVGQSPFAAAALGGTVGLAGGALANTYALGSKMWNNRKAIGGEGAFKSLMDGQKGFKGLMRGAGNVFSPIGGATSSMFRSGAASAKNKDVFKGVGSGVKASVEARDIRDKRQTADYGVFTRGVDSLRGMSGVDTQAKLSANTIKNELTDLRRRQAQFDSIAENIAISRNFSPEQISNLTGATYNDAGNTRTFSYSDGTTTTYNLSDQTSIDLGNYIDSLKRSTETSVEIIKKEKNLRIYEKEDSKKSN